MIKILLSLFVILLYGCSIKSPTEKSNQQAKNESGREYQYKTSKKGECTETKSVQQQTKDVSHPYQSHWEAGKVKTKNGQPRMKIWKTKTT